MDIHCLLNDNKSKKNDSVVYIGTTKKSILLGPFSDNRTCQSCFKKRLESSSFCDIKEYYHLSANKVSQYKSLFFEFDFLNKMIEFDKRSKRVIFYHHIVCIPGEHK